MSRVEAGNDPALALEVKGLTKRYPLFNRRRDRVQAFLGRYKGLAFKTALEDVTFNASRGEVLGVIGENGSGKSTLLRLVAGISTPSAGDVRVDQPVAGILELGLGFHADFTGRENALLYGSLLGLPEQVVRERLGEVLAFAELGDAIDQPLRTYSSGMTARLAFAVATHVDPRVLVVDEALAVGDGVFQKKCIDRMVHFKDEGRTVLFCSHAMYVVTSFCQRAIWLHKGRIRQQGATQEVVEAYETYMMHREKRRADKEQGEGEMPARGSRGRLRRLAVVDLAGREASRFAPGDGFELVLEVTGAEPSLRYHVGISIDTPDGRCLLGAATHWDDMKPLEGRSAYEVRLQVPRLPVAAGTFLVSAFLFDENGLHIWDQVVLPAAINVVSARWTPSLLHVPHRWVVPA